MIDTELIADKIHDAGVKLAELQELFDEIRALAVKKQARPIEVDPDFPWAPKP